MVEEHHLLHCMRPNALTHWHYLSHPLLEWYVWGVIGYQVRPGMTSVPDILDSFWRSPKDGQITGANTMVGVDVEWWLQCRHFHLNLSLYFNFICSALWFYCEFEYFHVMRNEMKSTNSTGNGKKTRKHSTKYRQNSFFPVDNAICEANVNVYPYLHSHSNLEN